MAGALNRSTRIATRSCRTHWNARSAGGAIVHFFGGASKPRFSLSGDCVFVAIRAVARTSGGTNAMIATRNNSIAARERVVPEGAMDIAGCKGRVRVSLPDDAGFNKFASRGVEALANAVDTPCRCV
jgi:hypothetical protein